MQMIDDGWEMLGKHRPVQILNNSASRKWGAVALGNNGQQKAPHCGASSIKTIDH